MILIVKILSGQKNVMISIIKILNLLQIKINN